jgi:hypothetical protein
MVESVTVSVPPEAMPPPPFIPAELLAMVESVTVSVPLLLMPPPNPPKSKPPPAVLPVIVQLVIVIVPSFSMPPPLPLAEPPLLAELSAMVESVIVIVPSFSMPPPFSSDKPPLIVMPAILAWTSASTVKIPKSGVPDALLRATVRLDAPGPLIVMSAPRSGRALASRIVPVTLKSMMLSRLRSA